jgi:hypothetical protein
MLGPGKKMVSLHKNVDDNQGHKISGVVGLVSCFGLVLSFVFAIVLSVLEKLVFSRRLKPQREPG